MILPLRRMHRAIFVTLALLLPALLVGAWSVWRGAVLQDLPPEYLPGSSADGRFQDHAYELVYWTTEPLHSDDLPEDAELVGTIRSGALALAPPAGKRVVVYSLAHDRICNDSRDPYEAYE